MKNLVWFFYIYLLLFSVVAYFVLNKICITKFNAPLSGYQQIKVNVQFITRSIFLNDLTVVISLYNPSGLLQDFFTTTISAPVKIRSSYSLYAILNANVVYNNLEPNNINCIDRNGLYTVVFKIISNNFTIITQTRAVKITVN